MTGANQVYTVKVYYNPNTGFGEVWSGPMGEEIQVADLSQNDGMWHVEVGGESAGYTCEADALARMRREVDKLLLR